MAKNYVAPDYMKEAFTCPHCGTLSLMHKICVSFKGASAITMAPNLRQGTNWVEIASCQNCKKKPFGLIIFMHTLILLQKKQIPICQNLLSSYMMKQVLFIINHHVLPVHYYLVTFKNSI